MNIPQLPSTQELAAEFRRASLGDGRRSDRLGQIVEAIAREPGETFPELMGADAELEAFYRFVNNEAINLQQILAPHFESTSERCAPHDTVLVLHDTTGLKFQGSTRIGLSKSKNGKQGFFAHVSLAVTPGETRCPLGLIGLETWSRTGPRKGRRSPRKLLADPTRESLRWHRAVNAASSRLSKPRRVIHVMDREGDAFELVASMVSSEQRFVTRVAHDRTLADTDVKLYESIEDSKVLLTREVKVSARQPGRNPRERRLNPARSERQATLEVSATRVVLARPDSAARSLPEELPINVVLVREIDAPPGVQPVVWRLLTTEPIATAKNLATIVDAYRSRWLIEELFKALKTGCRYEHRQLESLHALEVTLGIFFPIAWRLLLLRSLSRQAPEEPAKALTLTQIEVLRTCGKAPLSKKPTNREVLLCLAALGGHIRNNGDPGWLVLGRAYEMRIPAKPNAHSERSRIAVPGKPNAGHEARWTVCPNVLNVGPFQDHFGFPIFKCRGRGLWTLWDRPQEAEDSIVVGRAIGQEVRVRGRIHKSIARCARDEEWYPRDEVRRHPVVLGRPSLRPKPLLPRGAGVLASGFSVGI